MTVNDLLDGYVALDVECLDRIYLNGSVRKPAHWSTVDADYEQLRTGMHTLFNHLGISTQAAAA